MVSLREIVLIGWAALSIATAGTVDAAGVVCKEPEAGQTTGSTTKDGSDGSFCGATSDGGPSLAKASGRGSVARAATDIQGRSKSQATTGGDAETDAEDGGTAAASAKSLSMATAFASGDHPGNATGVDKTKATADAGKAGIANATAVSQGEAVADSISGTATAHSDGGGGFAKASAFRTGSVAFSQTLEGDCNATSGASSGGDASAVCSHELAIAKAFAKQPGSKANATSSADCTTKATSESGGNASAMCTKSDSIVKAKATRGATAMGSDTEAPFCDTSGGGTAKVTSPMGNCP